MRCIIGIAALSTLVAIGAVNAQHKGSGSGSGSVSAASAPYAGLDGRQVSSLSDAEIKGLLDGRGMSFALPAELNGYPGPMHILELAAELHLTDDQKQRVQVIFDRMKQRARAAGASYVEAEKALDHAFKSGAADRASIRRLTIEADQKRAEKRLTHLDAHLESAPVLTPEQRATYAELRGYSSPSRKP